MDAELDVDGTVGPQRFNHLADTRLSSGYGSTTPGMCTRPQLPAHHDAGVAAPVEHQRASAYSCAVQKVL